jgi:hypothetical protein
MKPGIVFFRSKLLGVHGAALFAVLLVIKQK